MGTDGVSSIVEAEKILNRTLAYQAAIAVHELKDVLDLDVMELRLVVAPVDRNAPGCYRVTCTVTSLNDPLPLRVDVLVQPEQAVARIGDPTKPLAGRQQAKPASGGRIRRSRS